MLRSVPEPYSQSLRRVQTYVHTIHTFCVPMPAETCPSKPDAHAGSHHRASSNIKHQTSEIMFLVIVVVLRPCRRPFQMPRPHTMPYPCAYPIVPYPMPDFSPPATRRCQSLMFPLPAPFTDSRFRVYVHPYLAAIPSMPPTSSS